MRTHGQGPVERGGVIRQIIPVFHFDALARNLFNLAVYNEAYRGGGYVAPFDPNPREIASFDFPSSN